MKIHELNKKEAFNNINLKVTALKAALNLPDNMTGEYFPKTVRQFNLWESKQNSAAFQKHLGLMKRNANSTLNKHPELKAELLATLQSLATEEHNRKNETKPERISRLKSEISDLKKYISLLESYTANQKIELLRTKEHFENEINKSNSIILELKKVIKNGD